ncbi:RISC-loading complex subunit TARBP2-like [Phymastichus coffea]|uniref:RISC-loading complex subunit TARBP2-like n=1 Tax=Phymastichus coffea TaxID=108790 RepID=UPI00273ADB96|nr:RISC-loading complex subunit TARBP2-like [Phymastichus coffea]XP_058792127.1 RISC-loading complex subunit TARBP2-like [Phymastichus coffea]XP_058792128.1 RISC-loading complex subunit TARBP2-like [Phymastichus coffea]XP_058792129.1 RISC-loading complex subunit TARBP2-like [Phymastichus coffea]XP_058792130.1 RISC-loading complex subunit TARBP2-like [Phymastichus coffea]XP_058792131.1 RISC-loading complex subunit TARBP2-like [Phymastichus coffea]
MNILPKTPVSILQEMMVKKSITPNYELIHNGGGTHQNTFTYQVSCDGLTATGTGRCKKDAKHEAAKAMLEAIAKHISLPQLPASPSESPVRTPLPIIVPAPPKSPANVPFRNTIGELQDLCSTNNLDDPVYEEISDVGPPHARVFTVQCLVSTFVEKGIATTKKQAKHQAAQKMIDRIIAVVSDEGSDHMKDRNTKKEQMASEIAIARYPELTVNHEVMKSKVNWGLKVLNFHKRLKESFNEENLKIFQDKLEVLSNLVNKYNNNNNEELYSNLKQELESTLISSNIQFYYTSFASAHIGYIIGMQLSTAPDISEIGSGKSAIEAEVNAIKKIIDALQFFVN